MNSQSTKLIRTLRGHQGWIGHLAWSEDGELIASSSADGTIKLWEVGNGSCYRTLGGHGGSTIACASFDSNGGSLVTAARNGKIGLWHAPFNSNSRWLENNFGSLRTMAYSRNGKFLAIASEIGALYIYNTRTATFQILSHGVRTNSVVFHPSDEALITGDVDGYVKVWEPNSRCQINEFVGHIGSVLSVAFAGSDVLISGGADKTVKIWDYTKGKLILSAEGHTDRVEEVTASIKYGLIASLGGQRDNSVRISRIDNGKCVATIPGRGLWEAPSALRFHPFQALLAISDSDPGQREDEGGSLINIWKLNLTQLLQKPGLPQTTYTSAKVVLVGESNVGKSYLAHRIATNSSPKDGTLKSTHGMKFWPLEPNHLKVGESSTSFDQRDVVLWDMGGQEEYRLIHQMFLHDTTVALILFDPTRGVVAFNEVETWNKSLEKQLRGRSAVKLLVGAKLDEPSNAIAYRDVEQLVTKCGFIGYFETSALTGRGVSNLCNAIADHIDWDGLGKTSRPELFQQIHEEIETRRRNGEIVISVPALVKEVAGDNATAEDKSAVNAVAEQLSAQGIIARSRIASGESTLVLQVHEIERYAGSLILASRHNSIGVPALELRRIGLETFDFPAIPPQLRLPRKQEIPVLDCTVQLMLQHGICFEHEGLLIFPSLFAAVETSETKFEHATSLYYDFAGAVDNIYSSLVAWLVLAREFGRVRLWSDRAEFESSRGSICGLKKVSREGGFAHMDVYFAASTPDSHTKKFISFVEDHLMQNGVEITERLVVPCPRGFVFDQETLRDKISNGGKDVLCPRCEIRHSLTGGALEARKHDPTIAHHTWALRGRIEKERENIGDHAVQLLSKRDDENQPVDPIRLLHLSDLHFTQHTPVKARLQWLLDDLKEVDGINIDKLEYLVISGDFVDRGLSGAFERAYDFLSGLTDAFGLSARRCILTPGNHDIVDLEDFYAWRDKPEGLKEGEYVKQGEIFLARTSLYPNRFKPFSDLFFHRFVLKPYALDYVAQGTAILFPETGIQFITLNSCWEIDRFNRKRSGINVEAVAHAVKQAQDQETHAIRAGTSTAVKRPFKIAVWHHAVAGPNQMRNTDFIGNLEKNGVRLALHGDIHEMRRDVVGYKHEKKVHVVGAGSFGARSKDRPESTPRLYNIIEIQRDFTSVRVHTRQQPTADGPWTGWYEWPDNNNSDGRVAYYDIKLC